MLLTCPPCHGCLFLTRTPPCSNAVAGGPCLQSDCGMIVTYQLFACINHEVRHLSSPLRRYRMPELTTPLLFQTNSMGEWCKYMSKSVLITIMRWDQLRTAQHDRILMTLYVAPADGSQTHLRLLCPHRNPKWPMVSRHVLKTYSTLRKCGPAGMYSKIITRRRNF